MSDVAEPFEFEMTSVECAIVDKSDIDSTMLQAADGAGADVDGDHNPNDVIYMKSWLVHSEPYVNANRYKFTREDILWAVAGGQFEPTNGIMVDRNHDFTPRGLVLGAKTKSRKLPEGDVIGLEITSMVWGWRFPDFSREIREADKAGTLEFSMAGTAQEVQCGVCGQIFSNRALWCDHLAKEGAPLVPVRTTYRAASVVVRPEHAADPYATGEIVNTVERNSEESIVEDKDKTALEQQLAAAAEATTGEKARADKAIADLDEAKANLAASEAKVASIQAALDTAVAEKAELASKVTGLEAKVAELEGAVLANKAVADEVADLKAKLASADEKLLAASVADKNRAREAQIREVAGNLLATEKVAELVSLWAMQIGEDGKVSGRADDAFEAFVEGLKSVKAPGVPPSGLVNDPQNGGVGLAASTSKDGESSPIDALFAKIDGK